MTFGPQKITLKLIYGFFPLGGAEKAPPPQIGLKAKQRLSLNATYDYSLKVFPNRII